MEFEVMLGYSCGKVQKIIENIELYAEKNCQRAFP
jgi:hypothetical protein